MPVEERAAENLLSIPFGSNASFPAEIMYCGGYRIREEPACPHRVIGAMTRNRIEFRPPSSKHGKNGPHETPETATTTI
jgi:hypothetical protein